MGIGEPGDSRGQGSRFGGTAMLPQDAEWPESEDGPLDHLARLDLAEVARLLPNGPLPDHGFLSFFCDTLDPSWSYTAPDPEKWRVRWDVDSLRPLDPSRRTLPSHTVRWEPVTTLPSTTEDDAAGQRRGLISKLAAVRNAIGSQYVRNRLLGWPEVRVLTYVRKGLPRSRSPPGRHDLTTRFRGLGIAVIRPDITATAGRFAPGRRGVPARTGKSKPDRPQWTN